MEKTTTYTASSSYQNNSATITVTITETWVEDRSGNRVASDGDPSVSASLSNVRGYTDLQQTQIKTIAQATAQAALNIGIDVGNFLGIVQGESEFGMVKTGEGPRKNALSNPSQYSGGRAQIATWGSPKYSAVLQYNLEQSIINVYQPFWKSSKGNLWNFLYRWNGNTKIEKNGLQQRENFANRVQPIINGIQSTVKRGLPTRTGYFESFGRPSSVPSRGVTPCSSIFICY